MADNDALVGILADNSNSSSLFSPVSGATPEEVARRRKRGESLLTQGSSVAPLAHWTQAAARGLQGAVGGLETAQARNDERAGQDSLAKVLAGTDSAESKMRALVSNPWAGDIGTRLATGQLQRQLDPIGERTRKAQMEAAEASAAQARNPDLLYSRRAEAAAKHGGGTLPPPRATGSCARRHSRHKTSYKTELFAQRLGQRRGWPVLPACGGSRRSVVAAS